MLLKDKFFEVTQKVSQMTDEEARMYPWLIIGTVSSVPDYEAWGEGKVKVNGRIWIRIR